MVAPPQKLVWWVLAPLYGVSIMILTEVKAVDKWTVVSEDSTYKVSERKFEWEAGVEQRLKKEEGGTNFFQNKCRIRVQSAKESRKGN